MKPYYRSLLRSVTGSFGIFVAFGVVFLLIYAAQALFGFDFGFPPRDLPILLAILTAGIPVYFLTRAGILLVARLDRRGD